MLKKLSTSEYAQIIGVNESTVRKQIKAGRIDAVAEKVNGRRVYKILVDENNQIYSDRNAEKITAEPALEERIQEAEIITDSTGYALVSMEQSSFDALFEKFENISKNHASSLEATIEQVRAELFEVRAENKKLTETTQIEIKKLNDELLTEKIKATQFEAEVKIKQLQTIESDQRLEKLKDKNKELEESLKDKENNIKELEKTLKQKEEQIQELRQLPFWKKKAF